MAKVFQATAVACGTLALVCVIVAVATSRWMQGCLLMENILDAVSKLTGQSSSPSDDQIRQMFKGQNVCLETGLFRLSMSLSSMISYDFAISFNAMDHFIQATAGLLIVGTILLVPAILLVAFSACSDSISEHRKSSAQTYSRLGCFIFIVAAILIGAGSLTYTIPQNETVHNPKRFVQQMQTTIFKGVSQMMTQGGGSNMNMNELFGGPQSYPSGQWGSPGGGHFPDTTLSGSPSLPKQDNGNSFLSDVSNLGGSFTDHQPIADHESSDSFDPASNTVRGYAPNREKILSNAKNSPGNNPMQLIFGVFQELDPVFGHSFYFAWIGFALAVLATVFTVLACRSMKKYSGDINRVPML